MKISPYITLRSSGELEKFQRVEDDANELKKFVSKENKSTSPKTNEMIKEVVETFQEMTLWGEMHEELQNAKMIPMSEMDEYIVQLNKELIATIVKQKEKNFIKMIMDDYVPKLLIKHNYRFLGTDGGGNHHSFHSSMSQAGLSENGVASWEIT